MKFDSHSKFLFTDGSMGRNAIVFGAHMSSFVHTDNKNILILGEGTTQGLDDTTLIAEAIYPINFTKSNKRFALSLHYNWNYSFLFVNATKIYQFKAKISKIKNYALSLGNISKDFTINNMKKAGLKRPVKIFSADFNAIYTNHILDVQKYLMKGTWHKIMFELIKKIFIRLLTDIVSTSNYAKCMSLGNQKCMIQSTLISLHPNEYSQEFHYYLSAVKLDRCVRSFDTLNDLSNKVCIPNKTKDLSLSMFNMTTGINESKMLTKHISC